MHHKIDPEKIITLNLHGKKGVRISKTKYDLTKIAILNALRDNGPTTLADLQAIISAKLNKEFDGKVGWYMMAVKLDLEARNIIAKTPNKSPQTLYVTKDNGNI